MLCMVRTRLVVVLDVMMAMTTWTYRKWSHGPWIHWLVGCGGGEQEERRVAMKTGQSLLESEHRKRGIYSLFTGIQSELG